MKTVMMALGALAITCSVAAWAGKPERIPIAGGATGELVTDCGDFELLTDYQAEGYVLNYFNRDGSLDKVFVNVDFVGGIYYNADDPSYWLPGVAEHAQRWYYMKDGGMQWVEIGSPFRVILPGHGPVLMGVGRLVHDLTTGAITFMAGRWDPYVGNFDAICAALRP
jgi:hypothetical protein